MFNRWASHGMMHSVDLGFASGEGAFDPSSLELTGWWRAAYSGVPWTASASAGISATNGSLVSGGVDPGVGATLNGLATASFTGTEHFAVSPGTPSVLTTAASVVCLFNLTSAAAAAANYYQDAALFTDNGASGGNIGLVVNASGLVAGAYTTISKQTAPISISAGWHLGALRLDGSEVNCRLDRTDATPVSLGGTVAAFTGSFNVGANYIAAAMYSGLVAELFTIDRAVSVAELNNIADYWNTTYGLSL